MAEIKETLELLEGVKILAKAVKKALADGKLGWDDAAVLLQLLDQQKALIDAISASNQVPAELKDLSFEEAKLIIDKVIEMVKEIKAA